LGGFDQPLASVRHVCRIGHLGSLLVSAGTP